IQPRLEETFELVRSHLEQGGFDKLAGRRVVLTGGASQMQGVRDLAGLVLDKQVRLGRPVGFQGLPEATGGPAFSSCGGLIRYALAHTPPTTRGKKASAGDESGGGWGRLGHWLKSNF
ncbi:MAG: cell division protein FtsA, partial [Magnetospirillum sp.]|nr:cell division protein FtsA [Magnetospirillum sp.]